MTPVASSCSGESPQGADAGIAQFRPGFRSNEDARVQLRELQTREAVLSLNTRRQKLILDNRVTDGLVEPAPKTVNPAPEQAAGNAQKFQQALQGNSAEENQALRRMGARIVGQQLAAEPAPQAFCPLSQSGAKSGHFRGASRSTAISRSR